MAKHLAVMFVMLAGCGTMPIVVDASRDGAVNPDSIVAGAPDVMTVDVVDVAPAADVNASDGGIVDTGPLADVAASDVVTHACVPGSTQVCACTDGRAGAQSCLDTGAGYGPCACSSCAGRVCGPNGAGGSCGTCPAGNTCSTAGACSPTAMACSPCATDAQCPGSTCVARTCDGVRGCAPVGTAECPRIGGVDCPYAPAYHQCAGSSWCGPGAACIAPVPNAPATDTRRSCSHSGCTTAADCPPVMPNGTAGAGTPYCGPDHQCYLGCSAFGACTFDGLVRCTSNATGVYSCY